MAVLRRHWTTHALKQFRERYNLDDFEPDSLIDLVDRIELKYRTAFTNPYWDRHSRVMIATRLIRRNRCASPRLRLIYNRRDKIIVTVLPPKKDPHHVYKIKILRV
jgi:hypothetical protein